MAADALAQRIIRHNFNSHGIGSVHGSFFHDRKSVITILKCARYAFPVRFEMAALRNTA